MGTIDVLIFCDLPRDQMWTICSKELGTYIIPLVKMGCQKSPAVDNRGKTWKPLFYGLAKVEHARGVGALVVIGVAIGPDDDAVRDKGSDDGEYEKIREGAVQGMHDFIVACRHK